MNNALIEEAFCLLRQYEPNPLHVSHVVRLALQLFDQLVSLHARGPRERLLLEAAGYLHDIGHHAPASGGQGHHKISAQLIREHPWTQLSGEEIEIVAQVARYHRKALPQPHEEFKNLLPATQEIVLHLAAILRLADAFDRTHRQLIQCITLELPADRIICHLQAGAPIDAEIAAACAKGDLTRLVFQRDLVFIVENAGAAPAPFL